MEKDVEDKKPAEKKQSKKDKALAKNTIEINPKLNEAKGKTVVLGWGRMNPITIGHEKLANKIKSVAKSRGASAKIYLTHSQDKKKNPLDYNDKINLAKVAFGRDLIVRSKANTIIKVMQELQNKFDHVVLVVGQDRVKDFETLLNKYNGKDYSFDSIEVISAGDRDPDAEGVEGMSASKMRAAAVAGKFDEFKSGLPKKLQSKAQDVYDMVRGGMKLAEMYELDEAVLTPQQRRQRALTMRKYKTKIATARRRAMRKPVTKDKIKRRARKAAIKIMRQKFSPKKGANYSKLTPAERMIIDKRVAKKKNVIAKIAKRLEPQIRKRDTERRKTRNESFEQAFMAPEVEQPKKKRYHQMFNKEGKVKLDKRFRAFRKRKMEEERFVEMTDVELLSLIEEIMDEAPYYGHDMWRTKKIASLTFKRGKYKKAIQLLKSILDRKRNDKGTYPHTVSYYAAQVARQFDGVDARTLENMLEEQGGAGDEGTSKLVKKYKKDTPLEEDEVQIARDKIETETQADKRKFDRMIDRARIRRARRKARETVPEEVNAQFESLYENAKKRKSVVNEEVTQNQIRDLEKFADRLLQKFGIDIEFTRHFADRMNDKRNNPPITVSELQRLFKKIHKEKGQNIRKNADAQVVLKDIQSDLNLPVVINYDKDKDEFEVVNKTIMRKKDFKTSNKVVKY